MKLTEATQRALERVERGRIVFDPFDGVYRDLDGIARRDTIRWVLDSALAERGEARGMWYVGVRLTDSGLAALQEARGFSEDPPDAGDIEAAKLYREGRWH